jgi:tetratricopeptide (TPR) repeat protein
VTGRGAEPNVKLAAVMNQAGVTNSGLARRVVDLAAAHGVHRRYTHIDVRRWLDGVQPKGVIPAVIAETLSAKLGRHVSVADIGLHSGDEVLLARSGEYPLTVADAVAAVQAVVGADRPGVQLPGAEAVEGAAWSDLMVQWLLTPDQRPPAIQGTAGSDVRALEMALEMFGRLDYQFGGGYARSALVEFIRAEVAPLVASPQSWSAEVLQAAAALLRLAGWTAYDTGAHVLAQRYLTQALRLATAAGDRALGGRILAGMSHQANFLGYHEQAVNLARAAQRGTGGQATPTAMALFHAMEARALAGCGDRAGVEAALLAAESWFERRTVENDPVWLRYFDRAELAAEFAHSYRDLGLADKAIEFGRIAVYEADPFYARSISFCQCVLAAGHLGTGDVEQGLELARAAVDRIATLRSVRARAYVRDFLGRLQPFSGSRPVADFVHQANRVASADHATPC